MNGVTPTESASAYFEQKSKTARRMRYLACGIVPLWLCYRTRLGEGSTVRYSKMEGRDEDRCTILYKENEIGRTRSETHRDNECDGDRGRKMTSKSSAIPARSPTLTVSSFSRSLR